jgi:ketosteroid isomerase-like protein
MSQENVETWWEAVRAFNDRDVESLLAVFHSDVVFKPVVAGVTDEAYRGEQGVRDWVAAVDEDFEHFVTELERVEDHGDFALAVARLHGRGRRSGAEVRRLSIHLVRFEDGQVIWWQTFATREEALEAVGLSE